MRRHGIFGCFFFVASNRFLVGVQSDWFQRQAQRTVVGRGVETDGIADDVVEFNVLCLGSVSYLSFVYA